MAKPYVRARLDLARNGNFDAGVDISADILQATITRGVEVDKWRHPASVCELQLDNSTHKYSPYAPGSILSGYSAPGFPLLVEIGYPVDTFPATATSFTGRTATYDSNFAWTGDVTQFEIVGTAAQPKANGDYKVVLDFGESDCWLHMIGVLTGTGSGIVFRYSDASNYWMCRRGAGAWVFTKVVAGVPTDVLTTTVSAPTLVARDDYLLLHGNRIQIFHISQGLGNHDSESFEDSFNATATKHGIGGNSVNTADRWGMFGGLAPQFLGLMDTIIPHPEPTNKTAYLRAFDAFENMARANMYWANASGATKRADQLVDAISDALFSTSILSVPLDVFQIIDTDSRTIIVDTDTEKAFGGTILAALYNLQDDEGGGLVYVHELGGLVFESSLHRDKPPHSTSRATWHWNRNAGTEADNVIDAKTWEWDAGFDRVENMLHYKFNKISRAATAEVWRLQITDKPFIAPGQTLSFIAVGSADGIGAATTPVATTDYTMNSVADGTGLNLTAGHVVALASTTTVLGNYRRVTVRNDSGIVAYITFLRLRAEIITNSLPLMARAENTESQNRYGVRLVEHTSVSCDNYYVARAAAEKRIALRSEARERVTFDMKNSTRSSLMQIAHRRVSDHVRVVFTPFGLDSGFFIEKKVISITQGGALVTCAWTLTKTDTAAFDAAVYNTAAWNQGRTS